MGTRNVESLQLTTPPGNWSLGGSYHFLKDAVIHQSYLPGADLTSLKIDNSLVTIKGPATIGIPASIAVQRLLRTTFAVGIAYLAFKLLCIVNRDTSLTARPGQSVTYSQENLAKARSNAKKLNAINFIVAAALGFLIFYRTGKISGISQARITFHT